MALEPHIHRLPSVRMAAPLVLEVDTLYTRSRTRTGASES